MCRHPTMRAPLRGCDLPYFARRFMRPGLIRAHPTSDQPTWHIRQCWQDRRLTSRSRRDQCPFGPRRRGCSSARTSDYQLGDPRQVVRHPTTRTAFTLTQPGQIRIARR